MFRIISRIGRYEKRDERGDARNEFKLDIIREGEKREEIVVEVLNNFSIVLMTRVEGHLFSIRMNF